MVRKIIDKSHRQNVKQVVHVKVNIGDKKKSNKRKRRPRTGGSSGGANSHSPYLQPFNPIYIQSGNPPHLSGLPEPNRLVQSIIDEPKPLTSVRIVEKHKEVLQNPLIGTIIGEHRSSSPISTLSTTSRASSSTPRRAKNMGDGYWNRPIGVIEHIGGGSNYSPVHSFPSMCGLQKKSIKNSLSSRKTHLGKQKRKTRRCYFCF